VASSGTGPTLGSALIAALAAAAGGTVGVRRSYTAKGWHAQISKLTSSDRGYQAAAAAGLSVNHRTLVDWLAERRDPSPANQRLIAKAYALMAGRWPAEVEQRVLEIRGRVRIGDDDRDRGGTSTKGRGTAGLLVDGGAGDWSQLRDAWESGDVDPEDVEEWFIEDILEADLGESSEAWEFPGGSYTVVIG
jgi:hypothetical protein